MKIIKAQYISGLEDLSDIALHKALADLESHTISNVNWMKFPYKPSVTFKIAHSDKAIAILFDVSEDHIKAVAMEDNGPVWEDSCVEFFFELPGAGYFNLEMNCGAGTLLYYVRDNTRTDHGFKDMDILPDEHMKLIKKFHTMPDTVEPEQVGDVNYRVGFFFPFELIRKYADIKQPQAGTIWRMNAYKCGDATSHPHWLSWNPVRVLNFHRPEDFGVLEFC